MPLGAQQELSVPSSEDCSARRPLGEAASRPVTDTRRWCFWINLPTCGIALVLLFFFLNLNPSTGDPAELKRTFDILGL